MAAPGFAFVGRHADNVIRVLLHQIRVQIVEREAHVLGVFLVNAKDDGLVESPVRFEEIGEVASDGFGARKKRDLSLEILGGVFGIGNLTSQDGQSGHDSDASPRNRHW